MPDIDAVHSLIDTAALLTFGEGEIVPIKRTVSTLALAVGGLSEAKADNLDYDDATGYLYLKSGNNVLNYVEISGGGGTSVKVGDVTNPAIALNKNSVTLTWGDPDDVVISGVTLAAWGGTRLVRKAGSAPNDKNDGTVVVDNKTRNAYATNGYVDSGLEYGTTYFYRWFPYTDGNKFTDGSSLNATPTREIIANIPAQSGTLTYDGTAQTPTWANYDADKMTLSVAAQTDAGTYTAEFTPNNGYCWSDSSITAKTVNWMIEKATLTKPEQSGTLTYNGNTQTASWDNNYDSSLMTVSDDTGINAGSYEATFAIIDKDNYEWSNGTTTDRTSDWIINKATGSVSVSSASVSLNTSQLYADITVSQIGDGALSVQSSNTSVATVNSIVNNAFRITGVDSGSCTVTVTAASTTNYTEATATISVTASFVDSVLNNNSWSVISDISAAGKGSTYWNVGDTKEVVLNGTIGTLTLSNKSLWVFILGFDHNASVEGNGITFGTFKDAQNGGNDVCLVDDAYGTNAGNSGAKKFALNHWGSSSSPYNTNYGGWKGCDARYDILGSTDTAPSGYGSTPTTSRVGYDASSTCATNPVSNTFMSALPSDLRAVMKPMTKYTDNKGNSSNVAANVTASVDYLPLLAEFEMQGARSYANEYERNSQAQYSYYANGNSKIKKRFDGDKSAVIWWCRSALPSTASSFCRVHTDGSAYSTASRYSLGLAPAFKV